MSDDSGWLEPSKAALQEVSDDARRTEAALRETQARYQELFEALDAGFCIVEMKFDEHESPIDYRLVEINPAFERQTGLYGAAGKWVSEAAPGLERHWHEKYGRVALTGEAVRFEDYAEPFRRWYDVHAFRTGAPGERRVAILFSDITARKEAEDRIRQLNATLEESVAERTAERDRLWTLSEDMLARADYTGMMSAVSPAWTRVLGFSERELLTRPYSDFMHPEDAGVTLDALTRMGETGRATRFENRILTADGAYKPIEWTVAPEPDGANFVAVGRDISVEKAKQAELEAAHEALRQSQKMEAVGQLTGGVAHDFNNLLTVIRGSVEMLLRPNLAEEKRSRYVQAIADTADRATRLTSQLLAFARRQALRPEVFEAGAAVAAVSEMVETLAGTRVAVETRLPASPLFVVADPTQFDTALVNMAVNARDAMGGEGRLTIEVRESSRIPAAYGQSARAGDFVVISISDTGSGIPAGQLDQIFEPFFTTKGVGKGTGLGLSQVFGFARQSGGEITVESEPGRGATFSLYLPRAAQPADHPETAVAEAMLPDGDGACVLVVEDNPQVGGFAVSALRELGFDTVLADNADAALAELARGADRFHVVFSDVVMPGMSGIELAQEIRRLYPDLSVLLASGYSHVLAEGGADDFELLHKPYSIEQLSRTISKTARSRAAEQPRHP